MLIYAHRDSSMDKPANTMAAFERAIADGADGIELDIYLSKDGVPVVIHDRELAHTTNGHGFVDELSLAELESLDAGQGETIPSFEQVVTLAAGRLKLYVEIKQSGAESATLEVLSRFPTADWIAASFNPSILQTCRELAPEAELWLISQRASDDAIQTARDIAATTISLWSDATSPAAAARLFAADLDLAVWTINDIAIARQAKLLGASAICTDTPRSIRDGLRELNEKAYRPGQTKS